MEEEIKKAYEQGRETERKRCEDMIDEIHKFYSLAVKAVESVRKAK